ncbi:MAG: hypothetical protein IPN68_06030, partial [Bacteroidetes bacterium]|nr:hypothetical protein [Bacteroidota bacterium]
SLEILADAVGSAEIATDAVTTVEILNGTIANADLDKSNIPLSGFGAAAAAVSLGGFQINNLANPAAAQDATTKSYVDGLLDTDNNLAEGYIWVGDAGGNQSAVDASTDGFMLIGDGTTVNSVDISGDIDIDNTGNAQIQADVVTTAEIALNTILANDIATDAVGSDEIVADAVGTSEIAADAVTSSEIATDAVGTSEIAADAVTSSEIATDAVGSLEILADAVGSAEIATDAVTTVEILNGTIANADLDKSNIPLSGFGAAAAAVSMGGFQINNLANPAAAQDATTKSYVDGKVTDVVTDGVTLIAPTQNAVYDVLTNHAALQTGVHGISIAAGKTFASSNSLLL